jgi:hypothetical protein
LSQFLQHPGHPLSRNGGIHCYGGALSIVYHLLRPGTGGQP